MTIRPKMAQAMARGPRTPPSDGVSPAWLGVGAGLGVGVGVGFGFGFRVGVGLWLGLEEEVKHHARQREPARRVA